MVSRFKPSTHLIFVFSPTPMGTLPSDSSREISSSVSYKSAPIIMVFCKHRLRQSAGAQNKTEQSLYE